MAYTKQLVILVAALLLAVFAVSNVAALATINDVKVNGVDAVLSGNTISGVSVAAFAGQTLPVEVQFTADADAGDVRIKVWVSGGSEYSAVTERFDVVSGSTYNRVLSVKVPSNIDPTETMELNVDIESKNDGTESISVPVSLTAQRESYVVEVLDVSMDSKVSAGSNLALDVVLRNRGSHVSDDTFVEASIPELGISARGYFGDLSAVDQGNSTVIDMSDAAERMLTLKIPAGAPAGVYTVEISAYNGDSATTTTRKVAVVGASEDTMAVSSISSKTFAVGEKAVYSLTLVNAGSKIQVYDLVLDTPTGLTVSASDSMVAIPAGSSKTIQLEAVASKAGKYTFGVNVHSNGELVKSVSYAANVEGKITAGNATVLLTVILAIVFVVLLVVLIVLLARKPKKSEEFGESYY